MNLKNTILITFIIFGIITGSAKGLRAQSDCDNFTISEAKQNFSKGNFDVTITLLENCLPNFKEQRQTVEASEILALTYLELENENMVRKYIGKVLEYMPNYQPSLDAPPRYSQLVELIKQTGAVQISSVSKRSENLYEAPATVMVITGEELQKRGYTCLETFFSDLPGFEVSRTYGVNFSNIYQRGYRSNNTERTLFLVDGVEENSLWSNTAFISRQYSLTNIEQVEIVYGPASTMYGANALVGVVNVITKNPFTMLNNKPFSAIVDLGYASYNTRFADVTLSGGNNKFAISTTIRHYSSDEHDLSEYSEYNYDTAYYYSIDYKKLLGVHLAEGNTNFNNTPYYNVVGDSAMLTDLGEYKARQSDVQSMLDTVNGEPIGYSNYSNYWLFNTKVAVSDFKLGFQFWTYKQGGTNNFNDNNEAGADNGSLWIPTQSFFYVQYDKNITDNFSVMNLAQFRTTEVDKGSTAVFLLNYSNGGRGPSSLIVDKPAIWLTQYYYQVSKQFRNEFKLLYSNTRVSLVGGLEIRNSTLQRDYFKAYAESVIDTAFNSYNQRTSYTIYDRGSYTVTDVGIYAQGTYKLTDELKLTVGGRYDYNEMNVGGGYGGILNPRFAAVYTYNKLILKAVYGQAFQNASSWARYSTNPNRQLRNDSIAPEKVTNYELTGFYKYNDNLFFDVSFYKALYRDVVGTAIVINPQTGSTTGRHQSIGTQNILGLQANITFRQPLWSIYANYTYTNGVKVIDENVIDETISEGDDREQIIGDIPKHHINIGGNIILLEKLNINLRMNYIGERPIGKGTSVPQNPGLEGHPNAFPQVFIVNTAITYEFPRNISVQLVGNNILNAEYFDPGVRTADGVLNSYRTPQPGINFTIRLLYKY